MSHQGVELRTTSQSAGQNRTFHPKMHFAGCGLANGNTGLGALTVEYGDARVRVFSASELMLKVVLFIYLGRRRFRAAVIVPVRACRCLVVACCCPAARPVGA
jgi:hypothetical protein